jgi:K+ transporter
MAPTGLIVKPKKVEIGVICPVFLRHVLLDCSCEEGTSFHLSPALLAKMFTWSKEQENVFSKAELLYCWCLQFATASDPVLGYTIKRVRVYLENSLDVVDTEKMKAYRQEHFKYHSSSYCDSCKCEVDWEPYFAERKITPLDVKDYQDAVDDFIASALLVPISPPEGFIRKLCGPEYGVADF